MRKTTFLAIFLLFISSALAQNPLVEEFSKELQGQKLSGPLGTLFGSEKINFHLETDGEVVVMGIVTQDKIVVSIEEKELEKPSLNVYADEETIMQIQRSEDPLRALKKALDEGKIKYKAVGFLNKIKFSFLSVFSNIASIFASDEVDNTEEKEKIHKEDVVKEVPEPEPEKSDEEEVSSDENDETEEGEEESDNLLTGKVIAEVEPENKEHIVKLTLSGFDPYKIDVKSGDTVTWKNVRVGSNFNQGMIIGVRECRDVKSEVLEPGEEYSYTFEEAVKCTIVDGIWTTKDSKVIVE